MERIIQRLGAILKGEILALILLIILSGLIYLISNIS